MTAILIGMGMTTFKDLALLAGILAVTPTTLALREPGGPDNNNYGCEYNGQVLKDGPPMSEKFSGTIVCKSKDTGKVTKKLTLKSGVRQGFFGEYEARSGKPSAEFSYDNGKLHGVQKSYEDIAPFRLSEVLNYVQGNQVGPQKYYNRDTGKLERVEAKDASGNTTTEIRYNDQGQLAYLVCGKDSAIPQDDDWCGRKGKVSQVKLFGFASSSPLAATVGYLNGKKQGTWKTYEDGKVVETVVYESGVERKVIKNGDDGKVTSVDIVADGNGSRVEYFKGTKDKSKEEIFKNGKPARITEYYQNGEKKRQEVHSGDKVVVETYNDDGGLTSRVPYLKADNDREPQQHGKAVYFRDDGKLYREENFANGKPHGTQLEYFFDDKGGSASSEYRQGILVSRKVYDKKGGLKSSNEYLPDGSKKKKKK